jgi:hypothetical protein
LLNIFNIFKEYLLFPEAEPDSARTCFTLSRFLPEPSIITGYLTGKKNRKKLNLFREVELFLPLEPKPLKL